MPVENQPILDQNLSGVDRNWDRCQVSHRDRVHNLIVYTYSTTFLILYFLRTAIIPNRKKFTGSFKYWEDIYEYFTNQH